MADGHMMPSDQDLEKREMMDPQMNKEGSHEEKGSPVKGEENDMLKKTEVQMEEESSEGRDTARGGKNKAFPREEVKHRKEEKSKGSGHVFSLKLEDTENEVHGIDSRTVPLHIKDSAGRSHETGE